MKRKRLNLFFPQGKWIFFKLILGLVLIFALLLAACAPAALPPTPAPTQPLAALPPTSVPAQPTTTLTSIPAVTASPAGRVFQGNVVEEGSGKPVAGAFISIVSVDGKDRQDAFSGADGEFQFELAPGSYRLVVSKQNYQSYSSDTPLNIPSAGNQVSISLSPKSPATATAPALAQKISTKCLDGICWYYGEENKSCEAVCSAHGGYSEATRDFAGSAGSQANCLKVFIALEVVVLGMGGNNMMGFPDRVVETNSGGLGCYTIMNQTQHLPVAYWDKDPTTAEAASEEPTLARLCGCQK